MTLLMSLTLLSLGKTSTVSPEKVVQTFSKKKPTERQPDDCLSIGVYYNILQVISIDM